MHSWIYENLPSLLAVGIFSLLAFLSYDIHTSSQSFERAYREYAVLAAESDASAYLPGAGNNPIRIELNSALIQILGNSEITSAKRLELSRRGLELTQGLERQVDAITPTLEAADEAAEHMNATSDFVSNIFAKGIPRHIVELAQERHNAISDIRAYSYRADSETRKILERIVKENGVLKDSYVQELNNLIPAQEEEFNMRTNRYSDLQNTGEQIQQSFLDFIRRFSQVHS